MKLTGTINIKEKIEVIIATEVERLFDKANSPLGLSFEDIKKLQAIVQIKDIEKEDNSDRPPIQPGKISMTDLIKALRDETPGSK